jgi:YbgC/YbaW family acyl-CoA thioester hydrolase
MSELFTHKRRIRLHDVDSAQVVFFARYYAIAHEAFEEFLAQHELGFHTQFNELGYTFPVVHSECDYRKSLWIDEEVTIILSLVSVGRRKFSLAYEIRSAQNQRAATLRTDHLVMDIHTRKVIPLPEQVKKLFGENWISGHDK